MKLPKHISDEYKDKKHVCERIHDAIFKGKDALAVKLLDDYSTQQIQQAEERAKEVFIELLESEIVLTKKQQGKRYDIMENKYFEGNNDVLNRLIKTLKIKE
jgi:hypothetical protein